MRMTTKNVIIFTKNQGCASNNNFLNFLRNNLRILQTPAPFPCCSFLSCLDDDIITYKHI